MPAASTRHIEPLLPNDFIATGNGRPRRRPPNYDFIPRRRRAPSAPLTAEVVPSAPDLINQPRVPHFARLRRRQITKLIPAQLHTPVTADQITQPRRLRYLPVRRARRVEVVPTVTAVVADPSTMWSPYHQPRRLRALRVRRARPVEVVPPQFNPPFPFAEISQPRRPRGLLRRRAKTVEVVPEQLANAAIDTATQPRRTRALRPRRAKPVEVVPPQFNPPFPFTEVVQPRRARGLLRRRSKQVEVVPTQIVVTNPDFQFGALRQARTVRGTQPRRRARVEAPLTQAAPVVDASVMWSPARTPRRALVRRARRQVEVVPAQLNPPFPFAKVGQPRRARGMLVRRSRIKVETRPAARIYFPKIRLF